MSEPDSDALVNLERSITPDSLIQAFLHDPPDKALAIPGHEFRAARYLSAATGEETSRESIKADAGLGDQLAAIAERLPMPKAGPNGERAVGPKAGSLRVHHPLSGAAIELPVPVVDEARMATAITDLCSGMSDRRALFRLLWRSLPEQMAALDPAYARLPADTRVPDHTLWHHADTVTAFAAAVGATGKGDYALLSFVISPVQSFIAAARSLRDLRNGSLLLSWLSFRAMRPILERIGPTALIFPSLRGNAMMDRWLWSEAGGLGSKLSEPTDERLLAPSLPNRFLALVPAGPDGTWANALADAVEQEAAAAWQEVAASVRARLGKSLNERFPDAAAAPLVLFDLLRNAERCAARGRHDDAVARCYRLWEWTVQWLLETECGIKTAAVDPAQLSPDLSEGLQLTPKGFYQIGLNRGWKLYRQRCPDSEAAAFWSDTNEGIYRDHAYIRNHSILAHGENAIGAAKSTPILAWTAGPFMNMVRQAARRLNQSDDMPQLPCALPEPAGK